MGRAKAMKEMWPCLTVAAITTAVAHGDVVRTVVPNTTDLGNPEHQAIIDPRLDNTGAFVYRTGDIFGSYSMDLDGNGTEDFRFVGDPISGYGVNLECAPGNAAWADSFDDISNTALLIPLPPGAVVGETVSGYPRATVADHWRGDSSTVNNYILSLTIPPAPPILSSGLFQFGTTAHAGLRFEIDGETHYGWVLIEDVDPNPENSPNTFTGLLGAVFVVEYAYETEPDTPIVIPEPSTIGLLGVGALALWLRRRRPGHPLEFIH